MSVFYFRLGWEKIYNIYGGSRVWNFWVNNVYHDVHPYKPRNEKQLVGG
jgi:hypothetical protein